MSRKVKRIKSTTLRVLEGTYMNDTALVRDAGPGASYLIRIIKCQHTGHPHQGEWIVMANRALTEDFP
jgi:hypothetical protein